MKLNFFTVDWIFRKEKNIEYDMEAHELKWVNPNDMQYGVNSFRLGGLQMWIVEGIITTYQVYLMKNKQTIDGS